MPPRTPSASDAGSGGGYLRGLVMPVAFIGAILVFVVPIPAGMLDVLLSANLTVAVVVLLTTLAIRTPQEFSAFPDHPADDHADAAGLERGDGAAGADPRGRATALKRRAT